MSVKRFTKAFLARLNMAGQGNKSALTQKQLYKCFLTGQHNVDYKDKVLMFVFAGREDRMTLLMNYILKLLDGGLVDYVHVWNFARTKNDFSWVNRCAKQIDGVTVFSLPAFTNLSGFGPVLYKAAYEYYCSPEFKDTFFIKCDDDVVYIDPSQTSFIDFLKMVKNIDAKSDYFMVSANVLNNGFCAYMQQNKHELIPSNIGIFSFPCEHGEPGMALEQYWDHGRKSQLLHEYFLSNNDWFVEMSHHCQTEKVEKGFRFSINFVGFKQDILPSYVKTNKCLDDEHYLTVEMSKQLQKNVIICSPLVVSHLSFYSQGRQDDAMLIKFYDGLLNRNKDLAHLALRVV
jgi:hypothetical protein